jgi:hypothetical protein
MRRRFSVSSLNLLERSKLFQDAPGGYREGVLLRGLEKKPLYGKNARLEGLGRKPLLVQKLGGGGAGSIGKGAKIKASAMKPKNL